MTCNVEQKLFTGIYVGVDVGKKLTANMCASFYLVWKIELGKWRGFLKGFMIFFMFELNKKEGFWVCFWNFNLFKILNAKFTNLYQSRQIFFILTFLGSNRSWNFNIKSHQLIDHQSKPRNSYFTRKIKHFFIIV